MNIKILFDGYVIGAAQSLSLMESPHLITSGQKLTVSRMRLDKNKIEGLFSKDFVHPKSQSVPIQIVVEDEQKQEILKVHNAWFESIDKTFTTSDWNLLEGIELVAESVSGTIG